MIKFRLLIFFVFTGCVGTGDHKFFLNPQKSYPEYLNEFKSCTGKGSIESKVNLRGTLSFSYKSQRDSTFFQFTDILGRKVLLMWITPSNISARDMIANKHYGYTQIMEIFPIFRVLGPMDITEFVWGVEPNYKKKERSVNSQINKSTELNFFYKKNKNKKRSLVDVKYHDKSTDQMANFSINNRNYSNEYINMRKFWKLLKY